MSEIHFLAKQWDALIVSVLAIRILKAEEIRSAALGVVQRLCDIEGVKDLGSVLNKVINYFFLIKIQYKTNLFYYLVLFHFFL